MLETLYPTCFRRYSSLAIIGPVSDGFSRWLVERGYNESYLKCRICWLPYIEAVLQRRGVRHVSEIGPADWAACRKSLLRRFPGQSGTTYALERYLHEENVLRSADEKVAGVSARYMAAYAHYLATVRGAAASTIQQNGYTASEFLAYFGIEKHPERMKALTVDDLETFVKTISHRFTRGSLRQIVGRLRCFLRFLAFQGEIAHGLDCQLDVPRVYREEQLPSTLPWETVQAILHSIDRSSLAGLRDFTMFFLMAIYGLRACDVAALTLDNIHWRDRKITIAQRKTGVVLELPLTDAVGTALHRYLKTRPRLLGLRQIFLRLKAPIGLLKTTALSRAFRCWVQRSGMEIPGRGSCHRIRHSYAVFLLRTGTPVKTIGDILGHRTLESTSTYLRLAVEDLRDVALPVPVESNGGKAVRA
jgi:integrase/recombinase XerD